MYFLIRERKQLIYYFQFIYYIYNIYIYLQEGSGDPYKINHFSFLDIGSETRNETKLTTMILLADGRVYPSLGIEGSQWAEGCSWEM